MTTKDAEEQNLMKTRELFKVNSPSLLIFAQEEVHSQEDKYTQQ